MKSEKKVWRKVLYDNPDYEDNYTDPSFLKDLRTNINLKSFTFMEAFLGATVLSNQISCICGFLIIFYLLYSQCIQPTELLLRVGLITSIGYLFYRGKNFNFNELIEDSKTLLTVLLFGYIFAPLLHTLTNAISTDTIFTMTFFVMLLNLICFDYGLSVAIVSKAVSLNAAIFGSICLASRLGTSYHAFVLLVISAIFFVLYPLFTTLYWHPIYLIPILIICCYYLLDISLTVLGIYIVGIIFINIICPWVFVKQQRYKLNIHGPWDEAVVKQADEN